MRGVPSPYTVHVHPYPTRYHGGIWKRPVFGMPFVHQAQSVFRAEQFNSPQDFNDCPTCPSMEGLGHVRTGDGVFMHPNMDGGGIFNSNPLYGHDMSGVDAGKLAAFFGAAAVVGAATYFGLQYWRKKS